MRQAQTLLNTIFLVLLFSNLLGPCLSYTNLIGPLTATDHGKRPTSARCKVTEISCPPRMHSKRQPLQVQRPGAQRPSPLGKSKNMKYHNKNEMLFKIPTDALIMDAVTYVYKPYGAPRRTPRLPRPSMRKVLETRNRTATLRRSRCSPAASSTQPNGPARGRCTPRALASTKTSGWPHDSKLQGSRDPRLGWVSLWRPWLLRSAGAR